MVHSFWQPHRSSVHRIRRLYFRGYNPLLGHDHLLRARHRHRLAYTWHLGRPRRHLSGRRRHSGRSHLWHICPHLWGTWPHLRRIWSHLRSSRTHLRRSRTHLIALNHLCCGHLATIRMWYHLWSPWRVPHLPHLRWRPGRPDGGPRAVRRRKYIRHAVWRYHKKMQNKVSMRCKLNNTNLHLNNDNHILMRQSQNQTNHRYNSYQQVKTYNYYFTQFLN